MNTIIDRIIKEVKDDISDEQQNLVNNALSNLIDGDSVIYDIALAEDGTEKAQIRQDFNLMDQKILSSLAGKKYSEEFLSGIRLGVAYTLMEIIE